MKKDVKCEQRGLWDRKHRRVPRKYGRRYPWVKWFTYAMARPLTLSAKTHFAGRVDTFAQQARNNACRMKLTIHVWIDTKRRTVTFKTEDRK